jgi:2-polyprenyl-3-methyl-5-hydroxy-6-metoxy-1,4-benzoquinol methylase
LSSDYAPLPDSSNFQKYQTRNPVMRWVIDRFLREVSRSVVELAPRRVVDLGCGEGVVAGMLRESLPEMDYVGIDVSEEAVNAARTFHPTLEFRVGSVFDPPAELGSADVTLCLEVIEHLEDPEGAMTRIMEWTRGHALISVPWEPWFRLGNLVRGRHIHDLGNHPEHIQQFTPRSFSRLLAGHSNSFRVWTCFPWILGLVRRP